MPGQLETWGSLGNLMLKHCDQYHCLDEQMIPPTKRLGIDILFFEYFFYYYLCWRLIYRGFNIRVH